jgi:hypothetical protein
MKGAVRGDTIRTASWAGPDQLAVSDDDDAPGRGPLLEELLARYAGERRPSQSVAPRFAIGFGALRFDDEDGVIGAEDL